MIVFPTDSCFTCAKKTPYNTCVNAGVDECVIWGRLLFYGGFDAFEKSELGDVLVI